jgi:hypothetical protein
VLLALTPKGEKVIGELALHRQEELRFAGPELVAALRRVTREGKIPSARTQLRRNKRKA